MKNPNLLYLFKLILTCSLLTGCQTKEHYEVNAPGSDYARFTAYQLQNMDQLRYWQNTQNIHLQSGVIQLYPDSKTYIKKFLGTALPGNPDAGRWSKEESGNYRFSPDSAWLLFSNDKDTAYYFPGKMNGGIYHQDRIEQYDSIWYSDPNVEMGVSGKFIYYLVPGK